ncbi:DUF2690 domain-containing protein, partial [Dictyobacter arantiisoli]
MRKILSLFSSVTLCLIVLFLSTVNASAHSASGIPGHHNNISNSSVIPYAGNSYNGQQPDTSGCWDSSAYIVKSATGTYNGNPVLIYLWYSPTCGTNWGDFQITNHVTFNLSAQVTRNSD